MKKPFFGRAPKVDPDVLNAQTAEVNELLRTKGPMWTRIANSLKERRGQNGIGEDFELSLIPKEAR